LSQNSVISCISLEKKEREKEANGVILNGIISLLLLLDPKRTREEQAFVPLLFPLILSPKTRKQT
jgi:hypothetical protein